MFRRKKALFASLAAVLLAAAIAGGYALVALDRVRPFYKQAVNAPPEQLETAAKRMESRVEELVSAPKPSGQWQTVFTDEEVNGWLVAMLREHYPDLLPPEVIDPRVAFRNDRCLAGYRYRGKTIETVISVEGTASLPESDLVAVRLQRAFAGVLPLPMSRVVSEVTRVAQDLGIPIRWSEEQGDPVLLVSVAGALSTDQQRRQLQRIELQDGKLILAGAAHPTPPAEEAKDVVAMLSTPPPTTATTAP